MSTKRIRRTPDEARSIILETAKRVMLDEGYAAVSTRRVAKIAGVSPTLVHYYYPTTDDLIVALYRHTSQQDLEILEAALSSDDPLSALWGYQTHGDRATLGVEFLALANHRKAIKAEIIRYSEHTRALQTKVLSHLLQGEIDPETCPAVCVATLITSVARNLMMEDAVGISLGHAETQTFVHGMLARLRHS